MAADQLTRAVKVDPSDVGFILQAQALRHSGRVEEAQTTEDLVRKISTDFDGAVKKAAQMQAFFGQASSEVSVPSLSRHD
jgi:hypothetical protein